MSKSCHVMKQLAGLPAHEWFGSAVRYKSEMVTFSSATLHSSRELCAPRFVSMRLKPFGVAQATCLFHIESKRALPHRIPPGSPQPAQRDRTWIRTAIRTLSSHNAPLWAYAHFLPSLISLSHHFDFMFITSYTPSPSVTRSHVTRKRLIAILLFFNFPLIIKLKERVHGHSSIALGIIDKYRQMFFANSHAKIETAWSFLTSSV